MSSQRNKIPENIVILDDSSDDEDTPSTNRTILTPTPPPSAPHAPPRPAEPPVATTAAVRSLDSQSFWKAGAYEEINLTRPTLLPGFFIRLNIYLSVFVTFCCLIC